MIWLDVLACWQAGDHDFEHGRDASRSFYRVVVGSSMPAIQGLPV